LVAFESDALFHLPFAVRPPEELRNKSLPNSRRKGDIAFPNLVLTEYSDHDIFARLTFDVSNDTIAVETLTAAFTALAPCLLMHQGIEEFAFSSRHACDISNVVVGDRLYPS
jgi:hypothetical protein